MNEAPREEKQVQSQLSGCFVALDRLEEVSGSLKLRLKVVIRDVPAPPDEEDKCIELVPLANDIRKIHDRIQVIIEDVEDTLGRLELE